MRSLRTPKSLIPNIKGKEPNLISHMMLKFLEKHRERINAVTTLPGGVFVILYEASQTKISHFANQVIAHQDVGSSQIAVHVVHPLYVSHSRSNLGKRRISVILKDKYRTLNHG